MPASDNTNNFQSDGSAQTFSGTVPNPVNSSTPSGARLAQAGLVPGANGLLSDVAGQIFNINFQGADGTPIDAEMDWRVRISMASTVSSLFYNNPSNPIMFPLSQTKGVVFPYTPSVTISHNARYGSTPLTHSNYASYFYEGSEVATIQIQGDFSVQNVLEGQYLMAVIQFFRACTKMFWGNDQFAGSPPPMVFLDGYGPALIPHVPCVITQFSQTLPADVDYVQIPVGTPIGQGQSGNPLSTFQLGGPVRLPTNSTLSVSLQPVYSRNNVARNFTLDKFARGALIKNGYNSSGGFL